VWASQGGIIPTNLTISQKLTSNLLPDHMPREEDLAKERMPEEQTGAKENMPEEQAWVKGASEEENERHRKFLEYCEERRNELRARIEKDEERMKEARRKEAAWELMRLSISYIKSKEGAWNTRRVEECTRIREEERKDRLAVVAVKKRKYGGKRLSKEESMRMKERTERRMEISKAKSNYWKNYRERGDEMDEEEKTAWMRVKEGIMIIEEEEESWMEEGERLRRGKETTSIMSVITSQKLPGGLSVEKMGPRSTEEEREGIRNANEVKEDQIISKEVDNKSEEAKENTRKRNASARDEANYLPAHLVKNYLPAHLVKNVREEEGSSGVRKEARRIETKSIMKKEVLELGVGQTKLMLEQGRGEDKKDAKQGDKVGGEEALHMGGRMGGGVRDLAVRNEAVGTKTQSRSSGIKDTSSTTFTNTDVLSTTTFGNNVKKLVTRFETCGTVAKKSFDFMTTAASSLDRGNDLAQSPSKRIKLSRNLQVVNPSTPPSRTSGKQHPRHPKPWWGHKGSSSSPSTRPRMSSSMVAGMPAIQPRALSDSMAVVSRWGSSRPRQCTRPPNMQSMPAGSGSSSDDNFEQGSAALLTAESGHAKHRPLLHLHRPESQEQQDLESATSPTPPEKSTIELTAENSGRQPSKNASLCISGRSLTVDQTPAKTYLQRPASPIKKGIKLHTNSCAQSKEKLEFITHQNLSTLTWKGIKGGGGADRSFISSSTLQPVGLVRCSLAGTNAHLQGRKTTCAVERPRNGPMRCEGYDDITMMSQPEIPGEKAISKTSPTKKTPA
jgi:hypothetical protein